MRRHPRLTLSAAIIVVACAFLAITGVDARTTAALVLVVATQSAAGAWWWHRLRPSTGTMELLGMGIALGTAAALVGALATKVIIGTNIGWLLPAVGALVGYIVARIRARTPEATVEDLNPATMTALGLAAVLGLAATRISMASYPLTWTGTWGRYHVDMLFFESLSTSLARLGPLDSIFTPDALVRYHWLVYAWSGQTAEITGAGPFVVLTRALPLVALLATSLLAITWARRLTRVGWGPSLAILLIVSGGFVGATYGTILNFDSPSLAMTTPWLLAASLIAVTLLEQPPSRAALTAAWLAPLTLLAFTTTGGKISSGAVWIGAIGVVTLIGLIRRSPWRLAAVGILLCSLLGGGAAYLLVISGSADPGGLKLLDPLDRASSVQGLNPVPGVIGIVAGTLILLLSISLRWAGLAWSVADPRSRWSPSTVLGLGFAVSATGTVILLSGGLNDTWFAIAASAPLAVVSAAGAAEGARSLGIADSRVWPHLRVWAMVGVAAALWAVVWVLWSTGASGGNVWVSTLRWLGPILAVVGSLIAGWLLSRNPVLRGTSARRWLAMTVLLLVTLAVPSRFLGVGSSAVGSQPGLANDAFNPSVTFTEAIDREMVREWDAQENAAAQWLRDHAASDDVVATNVTFSPLVPALTGLRTWVSGIAYQAPYGRPSGIPVLLEREKQSWDFVNTPTRATRAALCPSGATWVWIDPTRTQTREWGAWGTVVLANEHVTLLKLDPSAC